MTSHGSGVSVEPYSPQRRTALLLTGSGTAGAYHAGVLKALHEAGVKIDVVAGHGVGAVGALYAAVDGGAGLWSDDGLWRDDAVAGFYAWRRTLRVTVGAIAVSVLLVVVPVGFVAAGLVVFPIDFVLTLVGLDVAGGLVARYLAFAQAAFSSVALPTWLPRLVLLVMGLTSGVALVGGWLNDTRRHRRGPFWWRVVRPPLSADGVVRRCWGGIWNLIRGAAPLKQPTAPDLGRRYVELLAENIGQPGFRELVIAVHDIDARRDLVFALVGPSRRRHLVRRDVAGDAEQGRADVHDLAGVGGEHVADAVAGALAIPLVTDFHAIRFAPDSFWRGETHRLSDRPSVLARLIEELSALDVDQVVLVSASPAAPGPHALNRLRIDVRGRLGEYLQSSEAAIVRDVSRISHAGALRMFVVQPLHNAVGPFDFAGAFDDRSDRPQPVAELINRGYEDAYRQFIEAVVGASGERVGQQRLRT